MGFPQKVADEALIRCSRHCCLCDVFAGSKIELHHIIQEADGGDNSIENCIPLCLNCHAEVKAYNPHHPKGRKYTEAELKGHRDKCFAKYNVCDRTIVESENADQLISEWYLNREASPERITWGLSSVDEECPLNRGMMALLVGDNGAGKSTVAIHCALNNILLSHSILYFHLKDSSDEIINRLISAATGISIDKIKCALLRPEEWEKISDTINQIDLSNIKLIPYKSQSTLDGQVLHALEYSSAEIVIVDDINAL